MRQDATAFYKIAQDEITESTEMDSKLEKDILDSISLSGSVDTNVKINENLNHILSHSSGAVRLQSSAAKRFVLILSNPLPSFSSSEIRCSICNRKIEYPCWHYRIKYSVNEFHYFICFDSKSADKPSVACKRK